MHQVQFAVMHFTGYRVSFRITVTVGQTSDFLLKAVFIPVMGRLRK